MRLKTKLAPLVDDEPATSALERINQDPFIAFFVSARLDIGNYVPLTKLPQWMESDEAVLCYFNLLYAYEVCDTALYGSLKGLLQISGNVEYEFCQFIGRSLKDHDIVSLPGAVSAIKRIQAAILAFRQGEPLPEGLCSAKFLELLCTHVRLLVPAFAEKRIVFLLDDFSAPKIPVHIQRTLLPIIWNSGAGYTFRVTAHSESVEVVDLRTNTYVTNRDYQEINIGAAYVNLTDLQGSASIVSACVDEILDKRFAMSSQRPGVSARKLLGTREPRSIAKEIRKRFNEKKLRALNYYGLNTVISLCSGDISYIIDIIGKMLEQRSPDTHDPISHQYQNRVIRQYARRELYKLQDYSVPGLNIYEIALQFGKMSLFKLINEDVGSGEQTRPAEYLRLEVQLNQATQETRRAIAELMRNNVFVDGGFGSSAQGSPTRRLIFRKLYTPAFPTTYNSRDTYPMSVQHFGDFSRDPVAYLRRVLGRSGVGPDQQQYVLDALWNPSEPE
jgi:hypothetical protein